MVPPLGYGIELIFRPITFFQSLKAPTRLRVPTAHPFVIMGSNNIRKFFKCTPSCSPALVQKFVVGDQFGQTPKHPPPSSMTPPDEEQCRGQDAILNRGIAYATSTTTLSRACLRVKKQLRFSRSWLTASTRSSTL
jgi:hypothetical protein